MIQKFKSLQNHKNFIKYFKNTSWLMAERLLRMIISLFVGTWIARYLGPEQYGILSYAQSFVAIFSVFATFGMQTILVRELVKNELEKHLLMGTVFFIKLIGSFIVLFLLAIAVTYTSNDNYTNTLIFILASAIIFQSFNVIDLYFQSIVLSKYIIFANSISLFMSTILKIIFILNDMPLINFVYLVVFDNFILACGYIYFYVISNKLNNDNYINIKNWKFDFLIAKKLLKSALPLFLSGLVVSIYMRIDQIMIQDMLGSEAVGYYSAAIRLSEVWYFIPTIITTSLFPAIIQASQQNKIIYIKKMKMLFNILVFSSIVIAVLITLFSNSIIHILYGKEFFNAGIVLSIHIWALVFISLAISSGKFLTAKNMEKKVFYRNMLGLVINLLLNFLLIPKYGITGAAIATLASWIVAGYIYDIFDKDVRYMFFLKTRALLFFGLDLIIIRKMKNEK